MIQAKMWVMITQGSSYLPPSSRCYGAASRKPNLGLAMGCIMESR
jgi:hypothetical protein